MEPYQQPANGNGTDPYTLLGAWDGNIPFRTHMGQEHPTLKRTDPERQQPQLVRDARIKVFNLSEPADVAEYEQIWDQVAKGLAVISVEERQYDKTIKNWRVFLRWATLFYEVPKGRVVSDGTNLIFMGGASEHAH